MGERIILCGFRLRKMKSEKYKEQICELLSMVEGVPGDIIEVGTYDGDTSEIICSYLLKNDINKKFYGLDTFSGYLAEDMSAANRESVYNFVNNVWDTKKEKVQDRLSFYGEINYKLIEGDCKKTIPEQIRNKTFDKFCLIYIDCNLYRPSRRSMDDLFPLLEIGGILAIDEHTVGGETRAIKEIAKKYNQDLNFFSHHPGPSYYFIKKDI